MTITCKRLSAILAAVSLVAAIGNSASAEQMKFSPSASRPTVLGPSSNFVGAVSVTPLFSAEPGTSTSGGLVTFQAGARSAWHTHPAGQTLIVTHGSGWVQEEGGPKREIKQGDVVWTPPGVKHWHGATNSSGMTHIAITHMRDGKNVDWLQQVSDEEYLK